MTKDSLTIQRHEDDSAKGESPGPRLISSPFEVIGESRNPNGTGGANGFASPTVTDACTRA